MISKNLAPQGLRRALVRLAFVSALVTSGLVAPAVAADAGAPVTVTTSSEIVAAFAAGGDVLLGNDITVAPFTDTSTNGFGVPAGASVVVDLAGHTLTRNADPDVDGASLGYAGIAVPAGASLTITDSGAGGEVHVTGDRAGAGIGGTVGVPAGTITINAGTVTATGGGGAAGIGGGGAVSAGPYGSGGTVTINAAAVTATGGYGAAGIGGGVGGNGGTVTINSGTVTATGGGGGAGIGGGNRFSSHQPNATNGPLLAIGPDATVTVASSGTDTPGADDSPPDAIGAGAGGGMQAYRYNSFGRLNNQGTLTIAAGSTQAIPWISTFRNDGTLINDGTIQAPWGDGRLITPDGVSTGGVGDIEGTGTIVNNGAIKYMVAVSTDITVTNHHYRLTFDPTPGSGTPDDADVYGGKNPAVYASTLQAAALPAPTYSPTLAGKMFNGWYLGAGGTGQHLTASTDLGAIAGASDGAALGVPVYAGWLDPLAIATTSLPHGTVGVPYSQTLHATGGAAPYSWHFVPGTFSSTCAQMPGGLAVTGAGLVTGTPTATADCMMNLKVVGRANHLAVTYVNLTIDAAPPCTAGTFAGTFNGAVDGGVVPLCGDLTLGPGDAPLVVPQGAAVTLDLAGHSLTVTGGDGDAGIGVPAGTALTVTDSVGGGHLTVTGGADAPGIGGDHHDAAGVITLDGGTTVATGTGQGAGIGGGAGAPGGNVTIGASATVSASSTGGNAIGGGSPTAFFGSLVNHGALTTLPGSSMTVPGTVTVDNAGTWNNKGTTTIGAGGAVFNEGTLVNDGVIAGTGALAGGTITNSGTILYSVAIDASPTDAPTITGHHYALGFDAEGGTGTPTGQTVYAATLSASGLSSSAWVRPARPGYTFTGWYLASDATGSAFADTTDLSRDATLLSDGTAIPVTLHAGWVLTPPPLSVTTTALPVGRIGVPYTATVKAHGGFAPYSWSVASGSLPNGMALDPATGKITGKPAKVGTGPVTLAVTDSATPRAVATRLYRITVTFTDVPVDGPFFDDITWLAGSGITSGYPDGTFRPTAPVSRQAMAALLYRYAHPGATPETCTTAPFPDVPATSPFCPAITWLATAGITSGYPDGTFRPTAPVSRQVMAALLHRQSTSTS